ncbi:MAG: hypothetical protein HYV60_02865 [Planctomycetia bacterium]|nr:hypothetical protein [Planctomycetia bacterium]
MMLVLTVSSLIAEGSGQRETRAPVSLEAVDFDPACGIEIVERDSQVLVTWPIGLERRARLTINLLTDQPLIQSISISRRPDAAFEPIAESLDPVLLVRVGQRDLEKRGGWTIFFDRMQEKPNEVFAAEIARTSAVASSNTSRATLTIGGVAAGEFHGEIRWTFYVGSPFVLQEAVVRTEKNATAFLYDVGLVCRKTTPTNLAWHDPLGEFKTEAGNSVAANRRLAVSGRAICAEFETGCVALFPPPHRYFYPLDFSDNLANTWIGPGYDGQAIPLVSDATARQTLEEVARLTRNDRYASLPGHTVFSSHYHVEHTRELLNAQSEDAIADSDITARLPSGSEYRIPERLRNPGFVRTFRDLGVDAVHLAEFHFGQTPRMQTEERLRHLEVLHAECQRLSDSEFLLLPGEEPNVHLGGHWISFFPKPVNWVLNRPEGTPFVADHPQLGKVYHVGGEADVLRLLKAEGGLAWTAHARIKGSTGFPDDYRQSLFFNSDRFLGAAWKAMPADLSQPRLGSRVLDLLDDMSNWGEPKYVLGEVDVFKIEPDHELYGHMNVNYLRLDQLPKFKDGWQPILDTLRSGQFFVTTGEVLIPEFTVNEKRSGERASLPKDGPSQIRLDLDWTFPLSYAELVSGNGRDTKRQRIDLSSTKAFGHESRHIEADLRGQHWARVEVWDVATNGAFTQPVWLESR